MQCHNFFHSPELFHMVENTPGQRPYMAVATNEGGEVVGHALAIVRRRGSWLPPMLYTQGRIYGEGEYADTVDAQEVFALILAALTRKLRRRLCFYIEFSDLSRKMFGYRFFRQNTYFPVGWQEVHNSLHSKTPAERLTVKMRDRIARAYAAGITTREACSDHEVEQLHTLMARYYRFKPHRLVPPAEFFLALHANPDAHLFVTLYKGNIIGGCVCVCSEGNTYLWYSAARRKRYAHLHPHLLTIWHALDWSWQHHYAHFRFLHAGLPYPHNPRRDFLLRFGGKPVANYRWFRFSIGWLNRLLAWLYNDL